MPQKGQVVVADHRIGVFWRVRNFKAPLCRLMECLPHAALRSCTLAAHTFPINERHKTAEKIICSPVACGSSRGLGGVVAPQVKRGERPGGAIRACATCSGMRIYFRLLAAERSTSSCLSSQLLVPAVSMCPCNVTSVLPGLNNCPPACRVCPPGCTTPKSCPRRTWSSSSLMRNSPVRPATPSR